MSTRVTPLVAWSVVAALALTVAGIVERETPQERTDRLHDAAGRACAAILTDERVSVTDQPAYTSARHAMRDARNSLKDADAADTVAIRRYLDYDLAEDRLFAESDADNSVLDPARHVALLRAAAEACDRLGFPQLREHVPSSATSRSPRVST